MDYNEQVEAAKARFIAAIPDHPEILTTEDVCELPKEALKVVHGLGLSGQQAQFALEATQSVLMKSEAKASVSLDNGDGETQVC